jgi:hypothetical protein
MPDFVVRCSHEHVYCAVWHTSEPSAFRFLYCGGSIPICRTKKILCGGGKAGTNVKMHWCDAWHLIALLLTLLAGCGGDVPVLSGLPLAEGKPTLIYFFTDG